MSLQLKFAQEAHRKRLERDWTQSQVAEAVSISDRWYQSIENGKRFPGAELMLKLIYLLEMDIHAFRDEVKFTVPKPKDRSRRRGK